MGRADIMQCLEEQEMDARQISQATGITHHNICRCLRQMRKCNLIKYRKVQEVKPVYMSHGLWVQHKTHKYYYSLT